VGNLNEKIQATLRRGLEQIAERNREAEKLSQTFPQIKWEGKDYELAAMLEPAWKQGKIKGEKFEDALEKVIPHFVNRKGKPFNAKRLAQGLGNKKLRG